MSISRRHGFTLIELLVVIAIIAILAAMLFPVFARARESARKIQCLSNVKNIAMAIQMYMSDYDRFPPHEHRAEVNAYFSTGPGGRSGSACEGPSHRLDGQNPYLRWPVILDEYIKNRDVWRCPSAKRDAGPWAIINPYGGDWMTQYQITDPSVWNNGGLSLGCNQYNFPTGWGGTLTDSMVQGANWNPEDGGFICHIGVGEGNWEEVKTSQIGDPTRVVVAADYGSGYAGGMIQSAAYVIFADWCYAQCGSEEPYCCNDVDQDPSSTYAGIAPEEKHAIWDGTGDAQSRRTRHLGGSNLGFADGHASWWKAGEIIAHAWGGRLGAGSQNPPVRIGDGTLLFAPTRGGCWCGCVCEYGQ